MIALGTPVLAAECEGMSSRIWTAPLASGPLLSGWPVEDRDRLEWGRDTARLVEDNGPVLVVEFPEGSINPGNSSAPEGGIGIRVRFDDEYLEGCLVYEVRFDRDFRFGEGGKLPGLFGGSRNSGCTRDTRSGFSARYMWGRKGLWFLYPYFADRTSRCGEVEKATNVSFETGKWHRIAQVIRLNSPGHADGVVIVWLDGQEVYRREEAEIRASSEVRIEGVLIHTFFGGNDPARASPTDQSVQFRRFEFLTSP